MGTEGLFPPEVKRPGRKVGHSFRSRAEINEWKYSLSGLVGLRNVAGNSFICMFLMRSWPRIKCLRENIAVGNSAMGFSGLGKILCDFVFVCSQYILFFLMFQFFVAHDGCRSESDICTVLLQWRHVYPCSLYPF